MSAIQAIKINGKDSSIKEGPKPGDMAVCGLSLKYVSLVVLLLQNALQTLTMRYARSRPGPMFVSTTAVVCSESIKVLACLVIILFQEGSLLKCLRYLYANIIKQPMDCVKISVPGIVYAVQNNLLYVAITHLDAATFQVTYQLKILTTALFSVYLLGKQLSRVQWLALLVLFAGVSLVQLQQLDSGSSSSSEHSHQHQMLGLLAVVCACLMSGFAGVYFEKVLKGTSQTLWLRNVQLGTVGAMAGLFGVVAKDREVVLKNGFFHGYDWAVWSGIMLMSCGGLIVAVVVKYADNILKGFATSGSIILSCVVSVFLFNFVLTPLFALGAFLVVLSVFLYSKFVYRA